ncbi:hypothetical protein GCM10010166_11500 [Couchioplanes caeruleus subsp. azureus]|nr:hypothetical protein GCM10010166_11500 [Couchioplanes caeruleus subsp. azureus]
MNGPTLLTDGDWLWRKDFPYYVRYRRVAVPEDFLTVIRERDYVVPDRQVAEMTAYWQPGWRTGTADNPIRTAVRLIASSRSTSRCCPRIIHELRKDRFPCTSPSQPSTALQQAGAGRPSRLRYRPPKRQTPMNRTASTGTPVLSSTSRSEPTGMRLHGWN